MFYLIRELPCIGRLITRTCEDIIKYKLSDTNGLCLIFIDHIRTGLTAGSNDDGNKALSPKEEEGGLFNLLNI